MQDNLLIDSHKLIYHPCRVADWIKGQNIYPIEIEISPSGACNHRCIFCSVDYMGYKNIKLDKEVLLFNLKLLYEKGLKSIVYAGEGEPLLNKDIIEIVNQTKKIGLDVAMSSNGVLFENYIAEEILPNLTWMRFSIAGIKESTYMKIHSAKKGDLSKVINNLTFAAEFKKINTLKVTLGVQLLLMDDNKNELVEMAYFLKNIGIDYFTIKPYYHHPKSKKSLKIDYNEFGNLEKELKSLEDENFKIYFRSNYLKKQHQQRNYDKCYGLPFMCYIDANGNVWPCLICMGDEELCYGNIYIESFDKIWEGTKRKSIMDKFLNKGITEQCQTLFCRLDNINRYLAELKKSEGHINFI